MKSLLNVEAIVLETARLLTTATSNHAALDLRLDPDLPPVRGDASQLRQLVLDLLTGPPPTAERATGHVSISVLARHLESAELAPLTLTADLTAGRYVVLQVAGTGSGGRLAGAREIVRVHEGGLTVSAQADGRNLVTIVLPSAQRERAPRAMAAAAGGPGPVVEDVDAAEPGADRPQSRPRRATVMLVDDEPIVRNLGRRMLDRLGYAVVLASGGHEAIDLLGAHAQQIHCVILDLSMPDLDGAQTLEQLHAIRPDLPVVLISGYDLDVAAREMPTDELAGYLQKPFTLQTLDQCLDEVLGDRPE